MKPNLLKLVSGALLLLSFTRLSAQLPACGDDMIQNMQRKNLKLYDQTVKDMNERIKAYVDQHIGQAAQGRPATTGSYTIPVVFHVIHAAGEAYGAGSNISYQQILSQVSAMNAAFGKDYPAYNGQTHPSYAQNTNIRFCLASVAMPASVSFYNGPGGIEKGVMRYADNALTNHQMTNADAIALAGLTHPTSSHFPFDKYLNIWLVTSIGGSGPGIVMGYAPRPLMGAYPLDGVVMRSDVTGDNSTGNSFSLGYNLAQGKVMVHEVGHYLNLMHIFEGGCAGANPAGSVSDACDLNGDMICDIEPCTTQNISCNAPVPNTCSASYSTGTTANDMIEDYMSYADDDCMNTFTQGQTLRMHATLNNFRSGLWQTANLAATGVMSPGGCASSILYIDIARSQSSYCSNTPISLSNATAGNTANSWTWTLSGGSPSSASTNSVTVTYTTPGLYYAKLRVSDGSISRTDSIPIAITSCTLDPKKLDRSNWLFGDSCSISFASGVPTTNNLVKQHRTIACAEIAVSMSDSIGNLLFYSDGVNLWDNTHTRINSSPILGWDLSLLPSNVRYGTSVGGFSAIQLPGSKTKYALICVPPGEIRYSTQSHLARISCAIYDAATKTISPYQSLMSPLVNGANSSFLTEALCLVPHCNGVDYWLIARSYSSDYANGIFYSFLFNQNGLNPNATPVVSGNFSVAFSFGGIKSNSTGNKLICNSEAGNYFLYDFNAATGVISNEVPVPVTLPVQTHSCRAGIFSPNDAYLYLIYGGTSDNYIQQVELSSLSVVNTLTSTDINFSPATPGYMEIGPDNVIYFNARNGWYLGTISNANSTTPSLGWISSINPVQALTGAGISLLNYVEAQKPAGVSPLNVQQTSCNSYSVSVDPCWRIYSPSWSFGDGSPSVNAAAAAHSYTAAGVYTVSLTLSYAGQSIPAYTRTLSVTGTTAAISGPGAICKGNTYVSNYSTGQIPGASYQWSVSNGTISGPSNIASIHVLPGSSGITTLSLQVTNGGCIASNSKTIAIDSIPKVSVSASSITCVGSTLTPGGIPPGGAYTGTGMAGSVFTPTVAGLHKIYYTYTNGNGCSNTASLTITVNACTGLAEPDGEAAIRLFPNPSDGLLHVVGKELLKFELFNGLGQEVLVLDQLPAGGAELDLSALPKGIYLARVSTAKEVYVARIVKE